MEALKIRYCICCALLLNVVCTMRGTERVVDMNNVPVPPGTKKIIENRYYEPIKQGDEWVCGVEKLASQYNEIQAIEYFDGYGNLVLKKYINNDGDVYEIEEMSYYDAKRGKLQKKEKHYKFIDGVDKKEIYIRDNEGKLLRIEKTQFGEKEVEKFEYDYQGKLLKVLEEGKTTRIGYSPENSLTEITYEEVYDEKCKFSYRGKYGLVKTKVIIRDKQTKALLKELDEFYEGGDLVGKKETEWVYNSDGKCVLETQVEWLQGGKYYVVAGMSKADLVLKKAGYISWRFNNYGDVIEYDIGTFDKDGISHSSWRDIYYRIYNEKGDCIKCTKLREKENRIEAQFIEIRTITYL